MAKLAYLVGSVAIIGLSFVGIKTLVSSIAQSTIDSIVAIFTAPITFKKDDSKA